jgi:hypothetical protein
MLTTIRLIGEPKYNEDHVIEDGYVEVEYDVNYVLDVIGSEDITQYALDNLRLINPEDFEYDIDHFTSEDMVRGLKSNGYNFSKQIDEEECIDSLEQSGYTVTYGETNESELDYIDDLRLSEIIKLYGDGSWVERDRIYKAVCS